MEKRNKIIYWIATVLASFGMIGSGVQQILKTKEMTELVSTHLGYPIYFMQIIGVWKILAVIVILLPNFKLMKEWAYAGLFFVMTGALASHLLCGVYGVKDLLGPIFQTIFIITSWYFRPTDRKIIP